MAAQCPAAVLVRAIVHPAMAAEKAFAAKSFHIHCHTVTRPDTLLHHSQLLPQFLTIFVADRDAYLCSRHSAVKNMRVTSKRSKASPLTTASFASTTPGLPLIPHSNTPRSTYVRAFIIDDATHPSPVAVLLSCLSFQHTISLCNPKITKYIKIITALIKNQQ